MKKTSRPRPKSPFVARWWVNESGYRLEANVAPADVRAFSTSNVEGVLYFGEDEVDLDYFDEETSYFGWIILDAPPSESLFDNDVRTYDPLEVSSLHRIVSRLSLDEESAIEFTNEFGLLGMSIRKLLPLNSKFELIEDSLPLWGESLSFWLSYVAQLQVLIKLWDIYQDTSDESRASIAKLVDVEDGRAQLADSDSLLQIMNWKESTRLSSGAIRNYDFDPRLNWEVELEEFHRQRPHSEQVRIAARLLLREGINEGLANHCVPAIDVRPGAFVSLIPKDLLGAIYTQFALEVTGQTAPTVKCPGCGTWFSPLHGKQIYCDERCKFRAYRQRKKTQGKTNAKND